MWLVGQPSADAIRGFVASQGDLPFSYSEVGATAGDTPPGYTVDHNRAALGRGWATFERAVAAVRAWRMFDVPAVRLCWPSAPIEAGTSVAILAGIAGLWSLNACRIVYVVDGGEAVRRFGFAYGTLPEHAVRGEERFQVEWDRDNDEVVYDLLALSLPGPRMPRVALPFLRAAQRRFAVGSKAAMRRAVGNPAASD